MAISAEQLAEVLASLGTSQPQRGADDLRRAPRVRLDAVVDFTPCDGEGKPAAPLPLDMTEAKGTVAGRVTARIENLSSRGICIVNDAPMATGLQFVLHLPQALRRVVNVLCAVSHCRPSKTHAGKFFIGAEIICPINCAAGEGAEDQMDRIRSAMLE